ncbi:hypothetical protein RCL1_002843 [Eukaryota sp. TZLM3-RCL]
MSRSPSPVRSSALDALTAEVIPTKIKAGSFKTMGLLPELVRSITRMGYKLPTPIQRKVIPQALSGKDVVAMARTGSGKTAAFLIPLLNSLQRHSDRGIRALIVSPSREIALQTHKFAKDLGRFTDLRAAVLVGGESIEHQFSALAASPDIIIATPGRLLHHIVENDDLSLSHVSHVVFDEADQLFELGFRDQLHTMLKYLPKTRQTLLFSATMPAMLVEFSKVGLFEPEFIRLDAEMRVSEDLVLSWFITRKDDKIPALIWLLLDVIQVPLLLPNETVVQDFSKQILIFVATKQVSDLLCLVLTAVGFANASIYGSMDQESRVATLHKFRNRKLPVLVVTDVAARGIDIPLLDYVINFDYPGSAKLFVHRVGRVARAGRSGVAYSLINHEEIPYMLDTHVFLNRQPISIVPEGIDVSTALCAPSLAFHGIIPTTFIQQHCEDFENLVAQNVEISEALRRMDNGYKLYKKTRPAPSSTAIIKAKELLQTEIPTHPVLLATKVQDPLAASEDVLQLIKSFKPNSTALEAKKGTESELFMRLLRSKTTEKMANYDIGKKRLQDNGFVLNNNPTKKKRIEDIDTSFIDSKFALPSKPGNNSDDVYKILGTSSSNSVEQAVLDLIPDEDASILKRKTIQRWDANRKKFVNINPGNSVKIGGLKIKNASGTLLTSQMKKTDIYKEWKKKTKGVVSGDGLALSNRGSRRGRAAPLNEIGDFSALEAAATTGGELKTAGEILKHRKIVEKRKQKMLGHGHNSSEKSGRGKGDGKKHFHAAKGKKR